MLFSVGVCVCDLLIFLQVVADQIEGCGPDEPVIFFYANSQTEALKISFDFAGFTLRLFEPQGGREAQGGRSRLVSGLKA